MPERNDILHRVLSGAADGRLYGAHRPMNVLSSRLRSEPWIGRYEYEGYSSSCVYLRLARCHSDRVSVYPSFQAARSGTNDTVTLTLQNDSRADRDVTRVMVQENVPVEAALISLRRIAFGEVDSLLSVISVLSKEDHILVDISDGWYSTTGIQCTVAETTALLHHHDRAVILNLKAVHRFPLELGAYLISELSQACEPQAGLFVCCDTEGWDMFTETVGSHAPLNRVRQFVSIEEAVADR